MQKLELWLNTTKPHFEDRYGRLRAYFLLCENGDDKLVETPKGAFIHFVITGSEFTIDAMRNVCPQSEYNELLLP